MAQVNIESDPLFKLLTDALRAGPGSIEWTEAVARFRVNGQTASDEYGMLLQAREHLASGKDYKSVRAGAGFTRKLFTQIDDEKAGTRRAGLPTANLIAGASVVAILGVLGLVAFFLGRGPGQTGTHKDELLPALFPQVLLNSTFGGDDLSDELVLAGSVVIEARGVRPGPAEGTAGSYVSSTVAPRKPVPSGHRFEVEADIQAPSGGGNVITQLFIHDGITADEAAHRSNELSWVLQGGEQKIRRGDQTETTAPVPAARELTVRIVIGHKSAAVYANKELIWTGEHGLSEGPKMPGIRFLRPAGDTGEVPVVKALRIRSETSAGNDAARR